jgi:hypothetical protein
MMPDRTSTPTAADAYVERNLDVDNMFFNWCLAPDANLTRLRSIVGPPGAGKTTFLRHLHRQLLAAGAPVLWLDLAGDLEVEQYWKKNEAVWTRYLQAADAQRAAQSSRDFVATAAAQSQYGLSAIMLADNYDDADDDRRKWVEQEVFIPFLFPADVLDPQTRIVMARRDELGLMSPRLRWEDVTFPLEGLEAPRRQMEALMGLPPPDAGVVVPARVIAALAALTSAAREALLAALQDSLTPNPFVNLCLLEEQLHHPAAPLAPQDYRDCLARYVARARLDGKYVDILIRRARQFPTGQFAIREYDDKQELGELVRAGAISHVHDSPGFQLEAAVVQLAQGADR